MDEGDRDKLLAVFRKSLTLDRGVDPAAIKYGETKGWKSLAHMSLVSAIEGPAVGMRQLPLGAGNDAANAAPGDREGCRNGSYAGDAQAERCGTRRCRSEADGKDQLTAATG